MPANTRQSQEHQNRGKRKKMVAIANQTPQKSRTPQKTRSFYTGMKIYIGVLNILHCYFYVLLPSLASIFSNYKKQHQTQQEFS